MADNVSIDPGTTTPIRTDDVGGGVQVQVVKLTDGTGGSDIGIPGDGGGLFVQEAKGSPAFSDFAVTDAAAVLVAPANADRKALIILNDTGGRVWLKDDSSVAVGDGLPVASGVPFTDDVTTGDWYARAQTGVSGTVYVVEVS